MAGGGSHALGFKVYYTDDKHEVFIEESGGKMLNQHNKTLLFRHPAGGDPRCGDVRSGTRTLLSLRTRKSSPAACGFLTLSWAVLKIERIAS